MKKKLYKTLIVLLILALLLPLTGIAMAVPHSFHDAGEGAWYSEAVQFVYENNIMGGVGNNQFDPQGNLTRAQVTALLFRVYNGRVANAQDDRNNDFDDVGNIWYAPYVTWAFNQSIVLGTSQTTFNPYGNITRQEFATMVHRYAMNMTDLHDEGVSSTQWVQFTDRGQIATWAYAALRWMNFHGIVTGSTTATINPVGTATRAEAAVMMMRFVEILPQPLCPEVEMRIRADWAARAPSLTPETVRIDHYFGTYQGKVALMISEIGSSFPPVVWEQTVAGIVFHYNSGQQIDVWYDGDFFSLPQAYEQGLITAENVRGINIHHRVAFPFMYM